MDWREREKLEMRKSFQENHYVDEAGVIRWKTNHIVPFDDKLVANDISLEQRLLCKAVRDAEDTASIEHYQRAQARRSQSQINEQRAEARAAYGPGQEIVNILTGERFLT